MPRPPPCLSKCGAGDGESDSKTPLLLNIEHGTEHDAPLSCITTLPPYLSACCYIVVIVERAIVETRR